MTNQGDKEKPKSQSERFIETACQLGCDEDEKAFDEKLKQIAKVKPKHSKDRQR